MDKKTHRLLLSLSDLADCNNKAIFLVALEFIGHEFECQVILSGWPIQQGNCRGTSFSPPVLKQFANFKS